MAKTTRTNATRRPHRITLQPNTSDATINDPHNLLSYMDKYSIEANPEAAATAISVSRFVDGIGLLVKQKLIDIRLVEELMGDQIIRYWDRMVPIVENARRRWNIPYVFISMEYLYHELQHQQQATVST